jgi:periplasmic protein TonB
MSYHVQQSSQQKSLGILVVIAFHVLLITGLVIGLKVGPTIDKPDSITYTNIKEKPVDVTPVAPPPPTTRDPVISIPNIPITVIDSDPPPPTTGQTDSTGGGTVIQATMSKPKLQNPTTPAYPTASVRLEEHGTTYLNLYITADGRVSEATVTTSSGYSRLDDAAVKHAQRYWKFTPCIEDGAAVGCWYQTKMVWKLENAVR